MHKKNLFFASFRIKCQANAVVKVAKLQKPASASFATFVWYDWPIKTRTHASTYCCGLIKSRSALVYSKKKPLICQHQKYTFADDNWQNEGKSCFSPLITEITLNNCMQT